MSAVQANSPNSGGVFDKIGGLKDKAMGFFSKQIDERPILTTIVLIFIGTILLSVGIFAALGMIKLGALFSPLYFMVMGSAAIGGGLVIGATHLMGKHKRFAQVFEIVRAIAMPILFGGAAGLLLYHGPGSLLFYPALIAGAGGFVYISYNSVITLGRRYHAHKSRLAKQKVNNQKRNKPPKLATKVSNSIRENESSRQKKK